MSKKYKGTLADLEEFGDNELAGAPCVGSLIAALPEDKRETYREERRAALRALGFSGTWREYFSR